MTTSNPGPRPRRAIVALIIAGILLVADVGAVIALHHRHRERVESVCLSQRKLSTDGNNPAVGNGPAFGDGPATGNGPGDPGPTSRRTIIGEKCGAFGSRGLAQRNLGGPFGGPFGTNNGNGSSNLPNQGPNTGPNRRYGNGFPPFTAPGSGSGNSTTTTTTTTAPAGVGQ